MFGFALPALEGHSGVETSLSRCNRTDGWTALKRAAYQGHDGVVAVLLDAGAAPGAADPGMSKPQRHLRGQVTASHHRSAALPQAIYLCCFVRTDGWTPLHEAAGSGHAMACTVLLEHGADPSLKNNGERALLQPLHIIS